MYMGIRAENNWTQLNGYESDGLKPVEVNKSTLDIFPSINMSYNLNDKNILRLAYGSSINRPEFRKSHLTYITILKHFRSTKEIQT